MNNLIVSASLMRRFENHKIDFLYGPLGTLIPHYELLDHPAMTGRLTGVENADLIFERMPIDLLSLLEAFANAVLGSGSFFRRSPGVSFRGGGEPN